MLAALIEALLLALAWLVPVPERLEWAIGILFLAHSLYLVSCYLILKNRSSAAFILAAGIVFRLTLWPLGPVFSEDLHRYWWEGKLQSDGGNPYHVRPSDHGQTPFRVPAPDSKAGYGPLIELTERWTYQVVSRIASDPHRQAHLFKLPAALFDLATLATLCVLLRIRRMPVGCVVLYAWSPLILVEFWGSGHNDALVVFLVTAAFLAAALDRWLWVFAALSLAAAAKLWPLLLFPVFIGWDRGRPRRPWQWTLIVPILGLTLWPYWSAEWRSLEENIRFLTGFLGGWRNNDSLFGVLLWITGGGEGAGLAAFAIVVSAALWFALRRWPLERAALAVVVVLLAFSANCHPWYLTWFFPMLVLLPWPPLLLWAALMPIAYQVLPAWHFLGDWNGSTPWRWWIYAPVFAWMTVDCIRRRAGTHSAPRQRPVRI